eukprot:CAMPEP_0175158404 /NCGR_PEP_ID=MMETSP0087-20121206/22791_1 /TAXON_ID=136419 /ORGANISM="Unknown Unknown, Strain D1" /LENGTH=78 /DNA_ID=CAMNT_0016446225 /DNA_START=22 /DNA_END=255 /DNA_ORIENTATION=+
MSTRGRGADAAKEAEVGGDDDDDGGEEDEEDDDEEKDDDEEADDDDDDDEGSAGEEGVGCETPLVLSVSTERAPALSW